MSYEYIQTCALVIIASAVIGDTLGSFLFMIVDSIREYRNRKLNQQ